MRVREMERFRKGKEYRDEDTEVNGSSSTKSGSSRLVRLCYPPGTYTKVPHYGPQPSQNLQRRLDSSPKSRRVEQFEVSALSSSQHRKMLQDPAKAITWPHAEGITRLVFSPDGA